LAEPPQGQAQRCAFGIADMRGNFIDAFAAGL
jgi:hypothetical protein